MSATVLSRTISSVLDKRIVLSNDYLARTMGIGTTWTKLRIVFRFAFNPSGSSNITSAKFAFGLCSGTTNIPGKTSIDSFLGYRFNIGGDMAYTANSGHPYYGGGGYNAIYEAHGSTWTFKQNPIAPSFPADPTVSRGLIALQYEKTSPWNAGMLGPGTTMGDISYNQALQVAEADSFTVPSGFPSGYSASFYGAGFTEDASHKLDTICFWWGHTLTTFELCDVIYCRLA